jgi:hypothetical protein
VRNFFNEIIVILSQFIFINRSLLTSQKIYYDILRFYRGYGLKFSFAVIFITTLIYTFGFLINIEIFDTKLKSEISKETTYLDYIVNQFPEINYDGKTISINDLDQKVIFIKNHDNVPIAVFDINNQIKATEKKNILLIFKAREINFPQTDYIKSISYKNILGSEPKNIANKDIKDFILKTISNFKNNILLAAPIIFAISLADYIIENFFIMILLYIICRVLKLSLLFKDIMRAILFASGPSTILSSILIFIMPDFIFLGTLMKLFCLFLLYKAIANIYSKNIRA